MEVIYCFSFNITIVTMVSIAKKTINITKKLIFSIGAVIEILFKTGRTKIKQTNIFMLVTIKKDRPVKSKLRALTSKTVNKIPIEKRPKKRYKLSSEYENVADLISINSKTN